QIAGGVQARAAYQLAHFALDGANSIHQRIPSPVAGLAHATAPEPTQTTLVIRTIEEETMAGRPLPPVQATGVWTTTERATRHRPNLVVTSRSPSGSCGVWLCRSGYDFGGCGSMAITASHLEEWITGAVLQRPSQVETGPTGGLLTPPHQTPVQKGTHPPPNTWSRIDAQEGPREDV